MSAAFDTLATAQDLEAAGIERRHAEAIAKAINHGDERAATKADLDTATTSLRADIEQLRAATKADLDTTTTSLRADIAHVAARLDGVRSELGTMRWAIGLLAAFVFAIGLRIFGLL